MAVYLDATYGKKIGLRGYSSHQYSLSVRIELVDLKELEQESARVYRLLQDSVDREIRETGFLPPAGERSGRQADSWNNGAGKSKSIQPKAWHCSPKQQELILRLCETNHITQNDLQESSRRLFGAGVADLDKVQASKFITELIKQFSFPIAETRSEAKREREVPNG